MSHFGALDCRMGKIGLISAENNAGLRLILALSMSQLFVLNLSLRHLMCKVDYSVDETSGRRRAFFICSVSDISFIHLI